jgi:disulfide bond formation protein DsbB
MDQPMTSTTLTAARPLPIDKILVGIAFLLALATIAGAWGSQLFAGLVPCELCLAQRQAYYWGLPVLALILVLWNRLPLVMWYVALLIAAGIFVWSTYMGGYHAGVEWGFWPGPTACTGTGGGLSFNDLSSGNIEQVIPCDKVQWRDPILKFSLAGYNALISAAIVVLLLAAIVVQARRKKR